MALLVSYVGFVALIVAKGAWANEADLDEQSDAAYTPPKFVSHSGQHTVLIGHAATLSCVVANAGDEAVSWYKVVLPTNDRTNVNDPADSTGSSTQYLFLERQRMTSDTRLNLESENEDDFSLTISDVTVHDSGIYECRIATTPEISLRQILKVNVPPTVSIIPEVNPYVVEPGQSISLTCHASGYPEPRVTWTRVGGTLPDGRASHNERQLFYENINRNHSGVYRCVGDNDIGDPSRAQISVEVYSKDEPEHAPTVWTARKFIPVNQGDTVVLSCNYSAYPQPQIHWFFSNFAINQQSQKYRDRLSIAHNQDSSTTTLMIKNVMDSDFGEYICSVGNNLGTSEQRIDVNGKPGPPYALNAVVYGDRIDFSWRLESAPDVLGYKLFYRKRDQDFSLFIDLPSSTGHRLKSDEWSASYTWRLALHNNSLLPNTEYEFAVQGYNQYGDGSLPKPPLEVRTPAKFDGAGDKMMDISLDDQQVDEDVDAVKDQRAMSKSTKSSGNRAIASSHLFSQVMTVVVAFLCLRSMA